MSQDTEEASSLIINLSSLLGTNEASLRLLLTIFAGYPIALVFRKFVYGKPATVQHLFFIATSFALGYWNYGCSIFHLIAAISFGYAVLSTIGGTALSVGIIFIFNLSYLMIGYWYMCTDNYDINWTLPLCILVLRQIGVAFDLYDGQQPVEQLSSENKKVALTVCPNILEFFAHSMFPSSFMVGPQFPMKRYQDFVAGKFSENNEPPNCTKAATTRFALGLFYLIFYQSLGMLVSDDYIISREYAEVGFLKKLILMGIWGRFTLYKYISCWLLTEGACILFGLAYNGKDENGVTLWNGVANVKLSLFENTTEFTHYIQSFNINTNHWVGQYVYKRLKFLGNRHVSQLAALLFLALWHGVHSGYYACFFFEFIVVYMERDVQSIVKSNETFSKFFADPTVSVIFNIVLRLYTFIFMGWCLMPFALLKFHKYWIAWGSVYHIGTLFFGLYPIIYGPIARILFKKRNSNSKVRSD